MAESQRPRRLTAGRAAFKARLVRGDTYGPLVVIIEVSTLVQAIIGREGNDGTAYVMFVLLLIAPLVILSRIMHHEVIGMETILGALCIYVLLGIAFAGIYEGINDFEPLGFFAQPGPKTNVDFLYFSFITQTTVGYGDLSPATDTGRVVVTFEALIGQVFLVTLVARLVSMYGRTLHRTETQSAGPDPDD